MKCQNCGRNNANVSYTRIINGDRTELHLCSECAKDMNIEVNFNFGFNDMFSRLFDDFSSLRNFEIPQYSGFRALERGIDEIMNDNFFGRNTLFGNNDFIDSSNTELDEALNNIQKKHRGLNKAKDNNEENKKDKKVNKVEDKKQKEIAELKAKIQEYIKSEEYEKAAVLRDKIKELEK